MLLWVAVADPEDVPDRVAVLDCVPLTVTEPDCVPL